MRLGDFTLDRELAARAEVLAYRLFLGPTDLISYPPSDDSTNQSQPPFGFRYGILGVGIHVLEKPVLFVQRDRMPETQAPVQAINVPELNEALSAVAVETESWSDVIVLSMTDPVPQVATGDTIGGARTGTAGAPVQWTTSGGTTQYGISTAGHVVGANSSVKVGSSSYNVAQCLLPAAGGIDIAIVELSSASSSSRLGPPHGLTGASNVDMRQPGGKLKPGQVVAKAGWFYWKSNKATYLDLYVTGSTISNPGDSGSVVTKAGSNEIVGMLVGASTGSLIQDARTQMGAITGLSGLTF
jgi:hypothetical protein